MKRKPPLPPRGAPVVVDTWGWLAHAHGDDAHHADVVALFEGMERLECDIQTSDYVLDEFIALLFRRSPFEAAVRYVENLFEAADAGELTIHQVDPERFRRAWSLRLRYADKPKISFTDLRTLALCNELGIQHVLSEDSHFTQVGMGIVLLK